MINNYFKGKLSQSQSFKFLKILGITIALLLMVLLVPTTAQSKELAPVVFDGRPLFQVSKSEPFTAQGRADWINSQLETLVESEEPPKIEIEQRNKSPIIRINGRYLLTVTQRDVVLENSPEEQAVIWSQTIDQAVKKARKERSSKFLWQASLLVSGTLVLAIFLHWGLGRLWRYSLVGPRQLPAVDENTQDRQSLASNLYSKLTLLLARTIVWVWVTLFSLNLFPITRQWSYRFGEDLLVTLIFFLLSIFFSVIAGQYSPSLVRAAILRFSPQPITNIYENFVEPIINLFRLTGSLILLSLSLFWLSKYELIYGFIRFFIDLGLIVSLAWLLSRLFRQFIRIYGIDIVRKLGWEVDELILVFEALANVIIGFIGILAFAQGRFDLIGLLAGLGIGGLAIAFAAQKTLEQLLSTIVLYLDRPFVSGEYIRLQSGLNPQGLFGRVESIGLRSTKIRTPAKSTLFVVPNSIFANLEIENISRGKKIMVLLYLDFSQLLAAPEQALVQEVIKESTNSLFGIDPGSTKINFLDLPEPKFTRARVTFFILGSSENSVQLRKRLLELANVTMSKKLMAYGIDFKMEEPTIYVESPVTI
ncbi:mechanosensitive ion channel [Moorena producens JHB]|uniref:Mechanosensitive ion channel n=1 Tax=Moorena producens (strain JHB) TaxID=1454205 RepID=A0A9Q9UWM4_MOOP1|nr:mechanosensitive ion channel domain-containing protein [Moorena producens]WAN69993.1 mechanosensitive ion channel [Moorena producens JHB]